MFRLIFTAVRNQLFAPEGGDMELFYKYFYYRVFMYLQFFFLLGVLGPWSWSEHGWGLSIALLLCFIAPLKEANMAVLALEKYDKDDSARKEHYKRMKIKYAKDASITLFTMLAVILPVFFFI